MPQARRIRPRSRASSVARLARSPSGFRVSRVGDELQREHRPEAAHLADGRDLLGDRVELGPNPLADPVGPRAKLRRRHLVEHGERRGAGERVAPERPSQPARVHGVHDLGPAGDAGERQAAAQRLPGDDEVRLHAVVLDRPDRPRAADARLHLVVDVEDAVRREQLLQPAREVLRHGDEAALPLHRLEHRAGDRLRIDVGAEQILERLERGVARDPAVRIRAGRAVDLGGERAEALLVDELRRHRHRQQRPPVEGVLEHDHRRAARRRARDLHGVLDPLRTGVDEDRALLARAARRELGEPLAHLDVRLVRADHEALVEVAVGLLVDGGDHRLEAVARVLAGDPAGEVDVAAPVDVPHPCAFRASDDDLRGGDPARDVPVALGEHTFRRGLLTGGHGEGGLYGTVLCTRAIG